MEILDDHSKYLLLLSSMCGKDKKPKGGDKMITLGLNHLVMTYRKNIFTDIMLNIYDITNKLLSTVSTHRVMLLSMLFFRSNILWKGCNNKNLNITLETNSIDKEQIDMFFELSYIVDFKKDLTDTQKIYISSNMLSIYHLATFFGFNTLKLYCEYILLDNMKIENIENIMNYCIHDNSKFTSSSPSSSTDYYIPSGKISLLRNIITWFRCCCDDTDKLNKTSILTRLYSEIECFDKYDPFSPIYRRNDKDGILNARDCIILCNDCRGCNFGDLLITAIANFDNFPRINGKWIVTLRESKMYSGGAGNRKKTSIQLHLKTQQKTSERYNYDISCVQFSKNPNWFQCVKTSKSDIKKPPEDFTSRTTVMEIKKQNPAFLHKGTCIKCKSKKPVNIILLDIRISVNKT